MTGRHIRWELEQAVESQGQDWRGFHGKESSPLEAIRELG